MMRVSQKFPERSVIASVFSGRGEKRDWEFFIGKQVFSRCRGEKEGV